MLERRTFLTALTSASYDYQTSPQHVTAEFDLGLGGAITVENLTLENLTTTATLDRNTLSLSYPAGDVIEIAFPGQSNGDLQGMLPDGNYDLVIPAIPAIDLNDEVLFSFFHLIADADHDRAVGFNDFATWNAHYKESGTWSDGDFNLDGIVDDQDYELLAANYGRQIPGPISAPDTATANALSDSAINVTWSKPESGEWDGFRVYRSTDGVNFQPITEVDHDVLTFVDNGIDTADGRLADGSKYWYRVRPFTIANGNGHTTNKTWAVTVLPAPTPVYATRSSQYPEIFVTWTDNATTEERYTVERREVDEHAEPLGDWYAIAPQLPPDTQDFMDQSNDPTKTYEYRVYATNQANESARSRPSGPETPIVIDPPISDPRQYPSDMRASPYVFVGDWSPNHTTNWSMTIGSTVFPSRIYPRYGGGWEDARYSATTTPASTYIRGSNHWVTMQLLGSTLPPNNPDYDYRAWIDERADPLWTVPYTPKRDDHFVIDNTGLLQRRFNYDEAANPPPPDPTLGKYATLHLPSADLDIDSDNNNGYAAPERSLREDQLETQPDQGKWIGATTGDRDGDSILDVDDITGIAGTSFVPMKLSFASNLSAALVTSLNLTFTFASPLRVWRFNADQDRSGANANIVSGASYSATALGLTTSGAGTLTLFVEAIAGTNAPRPIDVTATVTGTRWSGTLKDRVHVRPVKLDTLIVRDPANTGNSATADASTNDKQFFIEASPAESATIELDATGSPDTPAGGSQVLWYIEGNDPAPRTGTFSSNPTISLSLHASNVQRRFNASAGVDYNADGILQEIETTHKVAVFLVRIDSLVVRDPLLPQNQASPTDPNPVDLLVMETLTARDAFIELDATGAPSTSEAGARVLWSVSRASDGSTVADGNLGGADPILQLVPTSINNEFTVKLGFDDDGDVTLDPAEVSRTVNVLVIPIIEIQATAFIKQDYVDHPTDGTMIYGGDSRRTGGGAAVFDKYDPRYRLRQKARFIPLQMYSTSGYLQDSYDASAGLTTQYNRNVLTSDGTIPPGTPPFASGYADMSRTVLQIAPRPGSRTVRAIFNMEANNPLVALSPDIVLKMDVIIDFSNPRAPHFQIVGDRSVFPCTDVYVKDQLAFSADTGTLTVWWLFATAQVVVPATPIQRPWSD